MPNQKNLGIEKDPVCYSLAVGRLNAVAVHISDKGDEEEAEEISPPTDDYLLPSYFSELPAQEIAPPWMCSTESLALDSPAEAAAHDIVRLEQLVIKPTPQIGETELGVFASENIPAHKTIGYYWGTLHLLTEDEEDNFESDGLLMRTSFYRVESGVTKFLCIDASKRSGVRFINSPENLDKQANVRFLDTVPIPDEFRDCWSLVEVRTVREILAGEELLGDYGDSYPLTLGGQEEGTFVSETFRTKRRRLARSCREDQV